MLVQVGFPYIVPAMVIVEGLSTDYLTHLYRHDARHWGLLGPHRLASHFDLLLELHDSVPILVQGDGWRWKVFAAATGKDFAISASVMRGAYRFLDLGDHEVDQSLVNGYLLVDVSEWPQLRVLGYAMNGLEGVVEVSREKFELDWHHPNLFPE